MTAPTFHDPGPPARRRGRLIGFSIASAIVALVALAFLVAGGALLYLEAKKDDDGYTTTATERLHTGAYAIASGNVGLDLDGAAKLIDDSDLGRIRLHAESGDGERIFLGIARSDDVDRYLRSTAHTTVTDLNADPLGLWFDPTYRHARGERRPDRPAKRDIWAASASGAGEQTLDWKVRDGDWSAVVMNADASRGVDVSVSAGAKLPFVGPAGWTSLGIGLFAAVTAGALLLLGFRGPRRDRPAATAVGPAQPAA